MHELSLAQEILDQIRPKLPEGGRLQTVQVTAGLLSGICSDSLCFCFSELAGQEGHPGVELKINRPPARCHCRRCQADYPVGQVEEPCPFCGALEKTLINGTEFTLDFIEIEEGARHV